MLVVKKYNEAKVYVESDDYGILRELYEYFSFYADGYKFMPAYRNKLWNGKIYLFDLRTQLLPYGLLKRLYDFAKERNYELTYGDEFKERCIDSKDTLNEFIDNLSLIDGKISIRDYQRDAVIHAAQNQRTILLSPTASGKSLIIYSLIRYYLECDTGKSVLVIVPTTSLVEQMYKDFDTYSSGDNEFDAAAQVHKIYSGKEKFDFTSSIVITTWQSAIKLPVSWFENYGMVIGDEAHTFKAKSLTTIMNRLSNAEYRIGTTGTLDNSLANQLTLEGNFGPSYEVTSTKKLIDESTLASLEISMLVLDYKDEYKQLVSKMKYQDEIDFIVSYEPRNRFITNLTCSQKGNTLILYTLVEKHGKPLHQMIMDKVKDTNRKVFFISGAVSAEEREKVREITEKEKDAIIVASSGTFSTGINIVNLNNIIFASPTKSQIRVLQSIGRGLRKSQNGMGTKVFDIADKLSWKKKSNYTLNHAIERVKIYAKQQFTYSTYEIELS